MMRLITADHYAYFLDAVTEMHRLRYRVFKERFDWDVQFSGDMELDEFGALQPAYLIQRARDNRVQGCVRLLPSTGPMLRDTFPVLLDGATTPAGAAIWESSRFALDLHPDTPKATHGLATGIYELFAGMIEFGLSRQLTEIVTVTDARMERILRRAGWSLRRIGKPRALGAPLRMRDLLKFQLRISPVSVPPVVSRVQCSGHRSPWPQHRRNPNRRAPAWLLGPNTYLN
jgi:acyl homoserine lactone synthase